MVLRLKGGFLGETDILCIICQNAGKKNNSPEAKVGRAYNQIIGFQKPHIPLHTQVLFFRKESFMSIHFLSHKWEVTNLDDGIEVTLHQQELDANTIADLVDELVELVRESGQSTLYVDFDNVRVLASIVFGKLITLDARLTKMACKLILCNMDSFIYQTFEATRLIDTLDIRLKAVAEH
jgi:anti-anti-sigma factor